MPSWRSPGVRNCKRTSTNMDIAVVDITARETRSRQDATQMMAAVYIRVMITEGVFLVISLYTLIRPRVLMPTTLHGIIVGALLIHGCSLVMLVAMHAKRREQCWIRVPCISIGLTASVVLGAAGLIAAVLGVNTTIGITWTCQQGIASIRCHDAVDSTGELLRKPMVELPDVCVICLEQGVGVTLPCRHAFHRECIVTWARVHSRCPTCRAPINM